LSSGLNLVPQRVVTRVSEGGRSCRELSNTDVEYVLTEDRQDGDGSSANNNGNRQESNPGAIAGWFLDFPVAPDSVDSPGERVIGRPVVRGGNVVCVSVSPKMGACESGGTSWVYLIKGCSGQPALDERGDPTLPWFYPVRIRGDIHVIKAVAHTFLDQLLLSDADGTLRINQFPGEQAGRLYWRQNLNKNQ
jgi:hypothetical protein